MKRAICHILFISIFFFTSCTNKKLDFSKKAIQDSLPIYLDLANRDSLPLQSRFQYNKSALEIIEDQENDSMHRVYLFRVANRYFNMTKFEEYGKISEIVLKKSLDAKDSLSTAKAYAYIGDYYFKKEGKIDNSFANYKKSENIYLRLNDSIKLGAVYMNIAGVYELAGDFMSSELYAIKTLRILKGNEKEYSVWDAYGGLGRSFNVRGEHEKALGYYNKALEILDSDEFPSVFQSKATLFNCIGVAYEDLRNHEKAIAIYKEALNEENLFIDKPLIYSILLDNLGYSNFRMGNYSELPDLYYQSLKIKDSIDNIPGIVYSKIHLSEYFAKTKDYQKSRKYAHEALHLSQNAKINKQILMCLKQLANIEPEKASFYKQEYIKLNDSLHLEERKMQNKFARIEYETDEIIIEKDKAVNQKWNVLWISIATLLSGLLFYTFRMQQSRRRELLLLKSQQKANEEIYQLILDQQQKFDEGREKEKKRIAKELHDGIMNRLASIRSNLFILKKKTNPETIEHCISQVAQIQEVEKEVRNIAHDLSHKVFSSKKDYQELLRSTVAEFIADSSLKIDLDIDEAIDWKAIDSLKKRNIYRIIQESLHNIRKHAQASEASIVFQKDNAFLELEINDNGVGFDTKGFSSGQGIKNIGSRVKEIDGDLKINSMIGQGTSTKIILPLDTGPN